jgi:predicted GIY-YIG superfamily endonuclease
MTLLTEPPVLIRGLDPALVDELPAGTVYLLHLDTPVRAYTSDYTWSHYIGHASQGRLVIRLGQHARGQGAKFLRKALRQGCTWHLARVWTDADCKRERAIKKQGGASRFCPSCGIITAAERQALRDLMGRYITPPARTR